MTKEDSEQLIEESEQYLGMSYPVMSGGSPILYQFIETDFDVEEGRYFPNAILRNTVPHYDTIKMELEVIFEYFNRPQNH